MKGGLDSTTLHDIHSYFITVHRLSLIHMYPFVLPVFVTYVVSPAGEDIYSFLVFTDEFCVQFLEELDAYEKCPIRKSRPNTMNRYGVSPCEVREEGTGVLQVRAI